MNRRQLFMGGAYSSTTNETPSGVGLACPCSFTLRTSKRYSPAHFGMNSNSHCTSLSLVAPGVACSVQWLRRRGRTALRQSPCRNRGRIRKTSLARRRFPFVFSTLQSSLNNAIYRTSAIPTFGLFTYSPSTACSLPGAAGTTSSCVTRISTMLRVKYFAAAESIHSWFVPPTEDDRVSPFIS